VMILVSLLGCQNESISAPHPETSVGKGKFFAVGVFNIGCFVLEINAHRGPLKLIIGRTLADVRDYSIIFDLVAKDMPGRALGRTSRHTKGGRSTMRKSNLGSNGTFFSLRTLPLLFSHPSSEAGTTLGSRNPRSGCPPCSQCAPAASWTYLLDPLFVYCSSIGTCRCALTLSDAWTWGRRWSAA
jgi:hypothetical protein